MKVDNSNRQKCLNKRLLNKSQHQTKSPEKHLRKCSPLKCIRSAAPQQLQGNKGLLTMCLSCPINLREIITYVNAVVPMKSCMYDGMH